MADHGEMNSLLGIEGACDSKANLKGSYRRRRRLRETDSSFRACLVVQCTPFLNTTGPRIHRMSIQCEFEIPSLELHDSA
jgi:hypothetical protein